MTLVVALRGCDGLVMATDSRITGPEGSSDVGEKFVQLNRDAGVMAYGYSEPADRGMRRLSDAVKEKELAYFREIEKRAGGVFKQEYERWVRRRTKGQHPGDGSVGFVLAGYDAAANQFRILQFESPRFEGQHADLLLKGQWPIAAYLMERFYRPEMTVREVTEFVIFTFLEVSPINIYVGGPVQLASVTLPSGFQRMYEQDVARRLQAAQVADARLKRDLLELFSPGE